MDYLYVFFHLTVDDGSGSGSGRSLGRRRGDGVGRGGRRRGVHGLHLLGLGLLGRLEGLERLAYADQLLALLLVHLGLLEEQLALGGDHRALHVADGADDLRLQVLEFLLDARLFSGRKRKHKLF